MFRRILVANRGEIALRVIRACERLGIETVAVHSAADADGPWLERATRRVCVGPARASESYLDADAILQAADQEGCQAVHPGYGFLSENAVFSARCAQQGLTFIGPPPAAIARMGDKAQAKRTMAAHGLPTIPGSDGALASLDAAREAAERAGYPVLLKARAGGGGKGMRRCASAGELERAWNEAGQEAAAAFGDGALYLEKWIDAGRHVEFQVLCDAYGNGVHLGERDCSIQRNHQKLIEESPSPALDAAVRAEMGGKVAAALAASGYVNAGTVEFLRAADGALYFMEINARLQVEHPVTEMVTGIDLVEQQIRIAACEPLALEQRAISLSGHAIEFRINAERVVDGFAPDPGTIERWVGPPESDDVRWDSVVREGYKIPPWYDSMIGKLIVHGETRTAAIARARGVLGAMRLDGVSTTIGLHLRLLDDPEFVSGAYDLDRLAAVLG